MLSVYPLTALGLRAICKGALRRKVLIMLSTVCIFPVSAQWVPLYDTSFPILVEQCTRTTLSDTLLSLLEFFVTVVGSGVHCSLFSTRYLSFAYRQLLVSRLLGVYYRMASLRCWVIIDLCSLGGGGFFFHLRCEPH